MSKRMRPNRIVSRATAFGVAALSIGLSADAAATFTWKSTAPNPGSWTTSANWTKTGTSNAISPGGVAGFFDDAVVDAPGSGAYLVYCTSVLNEDVENITLNSPNATVAVGWNGTANSTIRRFGVRTLFDIQQGTFRVGRGGSTAVVSGAGKVIVRSDGMIDVRAAGGITFPETFSNSGGLEIQPGGEMLIGVNTTNDSGVTAADNAQYVQVAGPFTNAGTMTLSTVSPGAGNSITQVEATNTAKLLTNTGIINVIKGLGGVTTFVVSSGYYTGYTSTGGEDAKWNQRNLLLALDNQGTLRIDNPVTRETRLGLATGAANQTNTGTMEIGAGSILRLTPSNTLENKSGGQITGSGKLEMIGGGSFKDDTNDGVLAPGVNGAGVLSVLINSSGTLSNSATARLGIELGGTTVGTQFDRLAVSGATIDAFTGWSIPENTATLNLAGNLDVSFINGFDAAVTPADSFDIVTASQVNGTFNNVVANKVAAANGDQFDVTYNPGSVTLDNHAAAIAWKASGSGSTALGSNWEGDAVPAPGALVAFLSSSVAGPIPVTVDAGGMTVGGMTFNNVSKNFAVGGTGTLTFNAGAILNVAAGEHSIAAPLAFQGAVIKVGAGTLVLSGTSSHAAGASLDVRDGRVKLGAIQTLPSLAVSGTGMLDVSDQKLVITTPGSKGSWTGSAYDGITGLVVAGRAENLAGVPQWNGAGIVTSMTEATGAGGQATAVAVATADEVGKSTFGGASVSGSDTLVMYTYNGDSDLSGKVDADDYFRIDANYNKSGTVFGWVNGDFNYDGAIDGDDYQSIDAGFVAQGAPLSPGVGVTAVPEPTAMSAVLLTAAVLQARRRRRA